MSSCGWHIGQTDGAAVDWKVCGGVGGGEVAINNNRLFVCFRLVYILRRPGYLYVSLSIALARSPFVCFCFSSSSKF